MFSRRNKREMASLLLISLSEQLEIWLSGKDYVHIVATTICNSNSNGHNALFWSLKVLTLIY